MDAVNHHRRQALHAAFLAILPRIIMHAQFCFRGERNAEIREEAIAEVVALAWKSYLRLTERGKDVEQFVSTFAGYAVKAVRNRRRLCGQERAGDAMAPRAQSRHRLAMQRGAGCATMTCTPLIEALEDNTVTPPDEQAAFRIDFACWLGTYSMWQRRLVEALMVGERTRDVADRFALSQGRISQMRREFWEDWQRFRGEVVNQSTEGPERMRGPLHAGRVKV